MRENDEKATFPVFLYKHMTSLHSISLATNYIHEIPEEIQRITGLVNLNLNYNKIMNLPRGIAHLTTLTALELKNNTAEKHLDWSNASLPLENTKHILKLLSGTLEILNLSNPQSGNIT